MKDIEREGAVVTGHVKWYDAVKGYGFVVPDDGGSDVMVHASCVRAFGRMALSEGARVNLVATASPRGLQASKLVEVNEPEGQHLGGFADEARPTEFIGDDAEAGPLQPARVKWFDKQKGFGFVNVFGKTEDVFVHMETVRRCGFQDLASGEGMAVRTFRGPRGLMVAELRLWETAVTDAPAEIPAAMRSDARSDMRGDPRSDARGDPRSDALGDIRSDALGDPRSDAFGDPRPDAHGDAG